MSEYLFNREYFLLYKRDKITYKFDSNKDLIMENIAIITCKKVENTWTGAGRFNAFNAKTAAFERYQGQDIQLGAYFQCTGCESDFVAENSVRLERLIDKRDVKIIHMSVCIKAKCHRYKTLENGLIGLGFDVVHGTH